MIWLRVIERDVWIVLACCDARGDCQVQAFLDDLETDNRSDHLQIVALLKRMAISGPPKDDQKSR